MGSTYRNIENITLTGETQRMVIKLVSRIDNYKFTLSMGKGSDSRTRAYSPYLSNYSVKKGK
jgi:hypothetical protein